MSTMQNDPFSPDSLRVIQGNLVNKLLEQYPEGFTWIQSVFQIGVFKGELEKQELKEIEETKILSKNNLIRSINIDCRVDFGLNESGLFTITVSNNHFDIGVIIVFESDNVKCYPMITKKHFEQFKALDDEFSYVGGKLVFSTLPDISAIYENIDNMCSMIFSKSVNIQVIMEDGKLFHQVSPDSDNGERLYILPECNDLIEKFIEPYIEAIDDVYSNFYDSEIETSEGCIQV